ncbi:CHAT domain-containing protein [Endothiovibrio diazotrophicus]
MPARFDLVITARPGSHRAQFCLLDDQGVELATHTTDFGAITLSHQQGLFDLRRYLRLYVEEARQVAAAAEIGVCIAEEVLGEAIFAPLWQPEHQRTLRIQLPGAIEEENPLAAALARVPWEIARPGPDASTLGERNLLVRVVHDMEAPATRPLALEPDEPLRVLFVFAEARGSHPLGMRQERRELQRLFEQEIYPGRRVVADFLSHGVTRERLREQILEQGGYHIVHWSGHGHVNLLELAGSDGRPDHLSGEELLKLFTQAGGFLPRLVLLSACHSGGIARVTDWNTFLALAEGAELDGSEGAKQAGAPRDLDLKPQTGFTGMAHALLQGGVPSVVAMRYAVGDDYARHLAVAFYRTLLAHSRPKAVAASLTLARKALLDHEEGARFSVADHATPLLYGAEQPGLQPMAGRSPALDPHDPCLHSIAELAPASHAHFVGRTWELAGLGAGFIGGGPGAKPVAVVTGLGGMGKTALAAEALELWARRFQWVLLYQSKPNPLGFEGFLRDVHLKLYGELGHYHEHVKRHRADAVYRDAEEEFTGPGRLERLTRNLLRALRDEPILILLDNFETQLQAEPVGPADDPRWSCRESAWDRCLERLADELVGSGSRVLVTSRRPLAALPEARAHACRLGPLDPAEAALYLRAHPALGPLAFGADEERRLAHRLLEASRFHPLLMDRLARLAAAPERRPQLLQALEALEQARGSHDLPGLFAAVRAQDGADESGYLEDALHTSLDRLLEDAGAEARELLWLVAVANEPVERSLLVGVWGGEGVEQGRLRQIKQMVDSLSQLPAEMREQLDGWLTPEIRAQLDALPPPARPDPQPLLERLQALGLVTSLGDGEEPAAYGCHELVRERIRARVLNQAEGPEWDEDRARLAYAERLETAFHALLHLDGTAALRAGARALVYCIQARAWGRLGNFVSTLVTGTSDPRLLEGLIPHLQSAVEAAPEGEPRWSCLCYLGDALESAGQPDRSLPFYEQAAAQARAAAEGASGAMSVTTSDAPVEPTPALRQAWADLAWITGNWAVALVLNGDLDAARRRHLESAEANKQAGRPLIHGIARELEALRVDVMQGRVEEARPEIASRLAQVAGWWRRGRAGERLPEAPDAEPLARTYISALDIAREADYAREDWSAALERLDATLEVEQALQRPPEEIGATRFNRATVLMQLPDRLAEARRELEACLALFQHHPVLRAKILSSLADIYHRQEDFAQALTQERRALALCEQLTDPADRAISHNKLANYLEAPGGEPNRAESARHRLAALAYRLAAGLWQHLQDSLRNYARVFRRARAEGQPSAVPRLAELLADPAFHPLDQWLRQRRVDPEELQQTIDQLLEPIRQAAEKAE